MTALDYLKRLPAIWINLDRSPDRAEQFERLTAPLFGAAHRLAAYDGCDYDAMAAYQFRDAVTASIANDPLDLFSTVNNFQAGNKYLERNPKTRTLYGCTMAVFFSHMRAIKWGLESGWERFMVLEDDAVPRTVAMNRLAAPPEGSHINVWGGAIPMAGHKSDNRVFNEGKQLAWNPLPKGKRLDKTYCATAYELTREAAVAFVMEVENRPMPFDIAWWYPMEIMGGHRLQPTGFVQTGISERSGSKRRLGATDTEVQV